MKVAIVGGGISALATAFYLKEEIKDADITLYEKEGELGGKMHTANVEGFLFEDGSNGFLSNKPDTLELVEKVGCKSLLLKSDDNARVRYIYKDALHRLPESAKAFLQTPLLSPKGKLRVAWEYFVPAKKDDKDETLQSFGYRRVGEEMTDTFLDAMVAGIFASSPDKISVHSAFPAVVKLEREYGGLFRGMLAKRKKEAGPGGVLMSFEKGVSSFINALAKACDIKIQTDSAVKRVSKEESGYWVEGEKKSEYFDRVILTTPSFVSAKLIEGLDERLAKELESIEYSPISVVGLGYNELKEDLNGFGLLTTSSSKKEVLGVLWDSSIFFDRAPKGSKSLRVMIGGQRKPSLALKEKEELVAIAQKGVYETMGIEQTPDVTYVKRWQRGIPNYKVGHKEQIKKIFNLLKSHRGLYLGGNAYYGVSLNDCVANAKKLAKEIKEET